MDNMFDQSEALDKPVTNEVSSMPKEIYAHGLTEKNNHGLWTLHGAKKHPQQQKPVKYVRADLNELAVEQIEELDELSKDFDATYKEMCKRGEENARLRKLLGKFIGVIEEEKSLIMYFNPMFLDEVFKALEGESHEQ